MLARRKPYIDILRIIACIMVIYNHTNERGFYRFLRDDQNGLFLFIWDLVCSILCKSAVPIFFMISGAMLLTKEEPVVDTYRRIPKILFDLVLVSLLYLWIDSRLEGTKFSVWKAFPTMIRGSYWHLWYLYAYIAFIFTLPFLRKFVKGLDVSASLVLFATAAIFMALIPIAEFFWTEINQSIRPSWVMDQIFIYPVMGYVFDHVLVKRKIKSVHIKVLWIINSLCLVMGGICEYEFLARGGEYE